MDDDRRSIYISDWENNRIIEWKYGAKNGQIIVGENRNNQFVSAFSFVVDKTNDSLIIGDYGNNRVIRWTRQHGTNGQIIISNIRCISLAMDYHDNLYVSDYDKDEVRRWKIGETKGTLVASGNSKKNQFNNSNHIFIDKDLSIYISDWG